MRLRLGRWLRSRGWGRLFARVKLPGWWPFALLAILTPICTINVAVAWVGRCAVFPLSPFFLKYKVQALGAYAWHRPRCAFVEDAPIDAAMLARAEQKYHLPCGMLGAIVHVESGGHPHRISPAGAMGPMQLIPPTARALGVSDPFDPEQAVDGAARYLHTQMLAFHSVRLAAAAYNAGPGAVVGHHVPQNGQTEIYVDRVMRAIVAERHARCAPPPRKAVAAQREAGRAASAASRGAGKGAGRGASPSPGAPSSAEPPARRALPVRRRGAEKSSPRDRKSAPPPASPSSVSPSPREAGNAAGGSPGAP